MLTKNYKRISFSVYAFLKNILINVVGTLSILEILVLLKIPSLISFVKKSNISEIKKISTFCIWLLVSQVLSEIVVGNGAISILKGLATTILFYFIFVFFFRILVKDINMVVMYPIVTVISIVIFGDQFDYASNDSSTFFKFYVAPIILQLFLFVVLLNSKFINKFLIVSAVFVSLFIIIGGARTIGFSLLISIFLYNSFNKKSSKNIKLPIFKITGSLLLIYMFFVFVYIPKLESGEWGSEQNRSQLKSTNSSPLSLLSSARPDFFITLQAFIDSPIFGHGSWAIDKNKIYKKQLLELTNQSFNSNNAKEIAYIPVHSIILSMGAQHGIVKFIVFLCLIFYVFKIAFSLLKKQISSHLKFYLAYLIVNTIFILLFSPITILKSHVAIAFSFFFALHISYKTGLLNIKKLN